MRDQPIKLLWTGGFDSTFRLLQLLLSEGKKVQPYYIIDKNRKSTDVEFRTMDRIRKLIVSNYPITNDLFKFTKYYFVDQINIDKKINAAWRSIKNDRHIGEQYRWLASFCKQYQISDIELSIQKHEYHKKRENSIVNILSGEAIPENMSTLFKYFSFPLKDLSKKDMMTIARKNEWTSILNKTWFCHRPITLPGFKAIPCGGCNPCIIATEEGFSDRIPMFNRVMGRVAKNIYQLF